MMFDHVFVGESKSYEEQLRQMLEDLSKGKDEEKPLPHMNQVNLHLRFMDLY